MSELRRISSEGWTKSDAERLRTLAESQDGVISRQQLLGHGMTGTMVARWLSRGRMLRVHPHVYALGHGALPLRGRLWAGLLYAGPEAVLSHTTAAWLWDFLYAEPIRIHLTVPGRRPSLPGVRVHHSRLTERAEYRGLPVTPAARTLLDLGSMVTARQLRRALSEADYRQRLDPDEIRAVLRRGRPGSRALRAALQDHMPQLAQTLSELEERFLALCESADIPMPEVNGRVGRMRVDALWRDAELAVELDGAAAHGGWAAIQRDRRREVALRAMGFQVVRYTWEQVAERPEGVVVDLRRLLDL